jgi:hypothetical protein
MEGIHRVATSSRRWRAAMAVRAAQRPMSTRGTPDPILPGYSRTSAHTVRHVAHVARSPATGRLWKPKFMERSIFWKNLVLRCSLFNHHLHQRL